MNRTSMLLAAAMLAIVSVVTTSASAQINSITVDELGHMTINGVPAPGGFLSVEPVSGLVALTYALPFAGNPGDFAMVEPSSGGAFSDLIRFPGNGRLYFFSEQDDGDHDLADVPAFPASNIFPFTSIPEFGPEGNNGRDWPPGPTGVGGDPNNPNLTYTFTSDAVPEPGTLMLAGLGGGLLLLAQWRRATSNRVFPRGSVSG
jgi:hypothetical protein